MKNLAEVKLNQDLLEKAEDCATPEELVALAKANAIELSLEDAEQYIAYLTRDLTEEELSQVAGGYCWSETGCDDCRDCQGFECMFS